MLFPLASYRWLAPLAAASSLLACSTGGAPPAQTGAQSPPMDWGVARNRMVDEQIRARGVTNERVLQAMRDVPRHLFVPAGLESQAYDDNPLPIGHGQTISQPYIVALMTELARPSPTDVALDVGTGSGYQAAVLARLVRRVYTIEIVEALAAEAAGRLEAYPNVETRVGDGYKGWPEAAPFDIIIVAAAPEAVPPALIEQLKPGGRLVIPVGSLPVAQELVLIEKDASGRISERAIAPVRFVPLVKPPVP